MNIEKSYNRKLNFELLRILCMVMVTTLHYLSHSGFLSGVFSFSYVIGWFFETICLVATDVFVIISCYFLYMSPLRITRIRKLHIKVMVISLVGVAIVVLTKSIHVSADLITFAFPVLSRKWGFVNNYIIFSLSYPILNNYIASINKEDHKKTIFAGVLIISAGSLLSSIMGVDYLRLHYGDTFIWFLFIYLIIAYIKKYRIEVSKSTAILIWIVPLVIQYASRIIISILSYFFLGEIKYAGVLYYGDISFCTLISALGLFLLFNKIIVEPKSMILRKSLLTISSASFGVYLIQEHPLLRESIWSWVLGINHNTAIGVLSTWGISVLLLFGFSIMIDSITKLVINTIV